MVLERFERVVQVAMLLLLAVLVSAATLELFVLLVDRFATGFRNVSDIADLEATLQRGFSGVLLVLLGLELIETVRIYGSEHHVRLETVFVVAMIAAGRHTIQLDYHQTDGVTLLGFGALVLALAAGYALVRSPRGATSGGTPAPSVG
jgi:uncharacterized membrane protein (DUF373 family)